MAQIPDSLLNEEQLEHLAGMVALIFMKMNKDQRRAMVKVLKSLRPSLDLNFPNGRPDEKPENKAGLILPPSAGEPILGATLISPK